MQLDEAKLKFIDMWGTVGGEWGITRSMAQIHAVLLLSEKPLCTDDLMESLQIARGNANMNLRDLMDWGLIKKVFISGDRKDYYMAHKDMWMITKQVMLHRKRRELEPLLSTLAELKNLDNTNATEEEIKYFEDITGEIHQFADRANRTLNTLIEADKNWLGSTFISLLR
jgi:DNA-binding transcriptional regulator GbsR (MarR family)